MKNIIPILLFAVGVIVAGVQTDTIKFNDATTITSGAGNNVLKEGANVTFAIANGTNTISSTGGTGGSLSSNITLLAHTYAAYGATDTRVVRYLTNTVNTGEGTAWTYATNAASASVLTILQNGIYSFAFNQDGASGVAIAGGITRNSAQRDVDIYAVSNEVRLVYAQINDGAHVQTINGSIVAYCYSNDVIRVQTDATTPNTANRCQFRATQIGR